MNIEKQYLNLIKDILENGTKKKTRNGDTISVFARQLRHRMSDGFPLLTTKKMAWKQIKTELLWFLRGSTRGDELTRQGCHIWDGDCYQFYLKECKKLKKDDPHSSGRPLTREEFVSKLKNNDEFARKWGELGPIYGQAWRNYKGYNEGYNELYNQEFIGLDKSKEKPTKGIDQIQYILDQLKTNPDSRRMLVSVWDPSRLHEMTLPPCHYSFQVYTRKLNFNEKANLCRKNKSKLTAISEQDFLDFNIPTRAISLKLNMRSTDVGLGLPFNIASYALLLEILAKGVNMVPEELISDLGDTHIYMNHIEGLKEQITRKPYEMPRLEHLKTDVFYRTLSQNLSLISHLDSDDFELINYKPHPKIKLPLSN